ILSCGQDGLLIYWDYLDGVRLQQYDLHMSLHDILHVNAKNKSIIMLAQTAAHKTTFSLMLWKRSKQDINEFSKPKLLIEQCNGDHRLVSFGCKNEYIGSGLERRLSIYSMKKDTIKVVKEQDKFNRNKAITCVACHPTDYCIASGLENGKIILWRSFFGDSHVVTSVFHWHALPVMCLDFTPNGSSLLSGGHECVLVRWQTEHQNLRDFKPRMGAPITHVLSSPDGTLYATKHADNVIQLLDINLHVQQVLRGLTQTVFGPGANDKKNPIPSGLQFDPRSRTLVTNGLPGHLQFYSLSLSRQLFNLDIVGQNYISTESMDKPKAVTEVTCTAISDSGHWLATFETWNDGFFSPELRLKFWCYSSEAHTYSLNTTVEFPHDDKITSMLFRPEHQGEHAVITPTLATVGADLCFKLWTLVDDSNIYRSNARWSCDSVGFYRRLNAGCADFSTDASTLAVGFEHLLTIWDPDNNVVRTTLSNSLPGKEMITNVKFGSHQCCHHLVVTTRQTLLAWDLYTLTIQWTISIQATLLVRDPASDLMLLVSSNRKVSIFRPTSPNMVYEHEAMSSSDILDAVFVPDGRHEQIVDLCWPGRSQIYVYNVDQQLLTLDLPSEQIVDGRKVRIAQNLPHGALSTFMAEKMVREEDTMETKVTMGQTNPAEDSLAAVLLHSNEPVSLLCEKYLSSLIVKKHTPRSRHDVFGTATSKGHDDSSSSEDDMETDQVKSRPKNRYHFAADVVRPSVTAETDLDQLLSKPLDWVQWCASLHLK
ncbi:unnamed protein product, partial [Candidula unifasciata]